MVPENDALVQVMKARPEILQQMLSTVLNIIMFEDCRNQWSMSRPLLGLILLNEEYFERLRDQVIAILHLKRKGKTVNCLSFFLQIIRAQPVAKQTSMATWFKNLMDGIERNLLTKNRDRYVPPCVHFYRFGNSADPPLP